MEQFSLSRDFHAYILFTASPPSREEIAKIFKISPFDVNVLSQPSIANLREFLRLLQLKPLFSDCKVGYIKDADLLSIESQNTLLKILEEPPPRTILVLTAKKKSLLPTILSRCQKLRLSEEAKEESFSEILNKSLYEQLKLAETLSKDEDLADKVTGWLTFMKRQFLKNSDPKDSLIIKELLTLDRRLNSNANKRLLLESFFIKINSFL